MAIACRSAHGDEQRARRAPSGCHRSSLENVCGIGPRWVTAVQHQPMRAPTTSAGKVQAAAEAPLDCVPSITSPSPTRTTVRGFDNGASGRNRRAQRAGDNLDPKPGLMERTHGRPQGPPSDIRDQNGASAGAGAGVGLLPRRDERRVPGVVRALSTVAVVGIYRPLARCGHRIRECDRPAVGERLPVERGIPRGNRGLQNRPGDRCGRGAAEDGCLSGRPASRESRIEDRALGRDRRTRPCIRCARSPPRTGSAAQSRSCRPRRTTGDRLRVAVPCATVSTRMSRNCRATLGHDAPHHTSLPAIDHRPIRRPNLAHQCRLQQLATVRNRRRRQGRVAAG